MQQNVPLRPIFIITYWLVEFFFLNFQLWIGIFTGWSVKSVIVNWNKSIYCENKEENKKRKEGGR